jgi:hypothetical protein
LLQFVETQAITGQTIMQTMTLEQLRATTDAGGVLGVTLQAQGGAFYVNIETRRGEAMFVSTKEKKPRKFIDPRKAMMLLREIGLRTMRVNAEQWRPEEIEFEKRQRPDSAELLKRKHQAADYDTWFRNAVEGALDKAGSPDAVWLSSDDMKSRSQSFRQKCMDTAKAKGLA